MTILDGGAGLGTGFIGMGNGFLAPQSRLHQHEPFNTFNYHQFTNINTGAGAGNGFQIGIDPTITPANAGGFDCARLNQRQAGAPIQFWLRDNVLGALVCRAEFTSGGQMPPGPSGGGNVDGFRIWNPGYINSLPFSPISSIDIWTGSSSTTHIRMDESGQIDGQNNRLEVRGRLQGFWFDAQPTVTQHNNGVRARYIFNIDSVEVMRIGTLGTTPGFPNPPANTWNVNEGFVRIGLQPNTNAPVVAQNRLEVDAFPNTIFSSPNGNGTGFSGIRLTDLTANSVPFATNPGTGVLSVDTNGNIIYVPGAGAPLVNYCPSIPTLTGHAGTFLGGVNGFNFYFVGNNSGSLSDNCVVIGKQPCGVIPPSAKLDVLQSSNSSGTGSVGIHVQNNDLSGGSFATTTIGIKSKLANPGDFRRVAGWFESPQLPGTISTAIFVPQLGGKVSIGYPDYFFNTPGLLEVNGNIFMNGMLVATSDQSYKINITGITGAINKIKKLNGIYFNWDIANNPGLNFETGRQVGFVAQNVDSVLPELVRTDGNNKKYLIYDRMVALLVQGIKEQQNLIDSLFNMAGENGRMANTGVHNQAIELSSDIILYQNMPNPFTDETVINYFLPDNATTAKMIFYDEAGRMIKEEIIENRGNGSITLKTTNLASGVYSYSLEVNGKSMQVRKMQKMK